jgi:hypothetical protein
MNRRIIPTIEALENSTHSLPHNDPLLTIASHGGGSWSFGTTPDPNSPDTYLALLQPAMRFRSALARPPSYHLESGCRHLRDAPAPPRRRKGIPMGTWSYSMGYIVQRVHRPRSCRMVRPSSAVRSNGCLYFGGVDYHATQRREYCFNVPLQSERVSNTIERRAAEAE